VNPAEPDHKIPLDIWYPQQQQQQQQQSGAITATDFPILVFGHCLFGRPSWYPYYWNNLVPAGYILVFPTSYDLLIASDRLFAKDLRYSLDWVMDNCDGCPSDLRQIIGANSKAMVSGHSMGASSAVYAVGDPNIGQFTHSFNSMMTLSACGGLQYAQNIIVPSFFFDGTHDCMCTPDEFATPLYHNMKPGVCKYEGLIANGTHCNFADLNAARDESCLSLEEDACTTPDEKIHINDEKQLEITVMYMELYMQATLVNYGNSDAFDALNRQFASDVASGVIGNVWSNCTASKHIRNF
jgi:hypothetical protein